MKSMKSMTVKLAFIVLAILSTALVNPASAADSVMLSTDVSSGSGSGGGSGSGTTSNPTTPPPTENGATPQPTPKPTAGNDEEDNEGDDEGEEDDGPKYACQILGNSGKFRCSSDGSEGDPKWFSVQLDAIREVDGNGDNLRGSQKNEANQFASSVFEFSEFYTAKVGDASAVAIDFETTDFLSGSSNTKAKMTTYMFGSEGTFKVGDKDFTANVHDVKWNVSVENWPFTDNSHQLEVDMQIKGPRGGSEAGDGKFNFGVDIYTANAVIVDGQPSELAEGYPKVVRRGSQDILRIRVPHFAQSMNYDPMIDTDSTSARGLAQGYCDTACVAGFSVGGVAVAGLIAAGVVLRRRSTVGDESGERKSRIRFLSR